MFVTVVIPVYNGAATIGALTARLRSVLDEAVERFEIVLVDDGSTDGSWSVITELAGQEPRVRGLALSRNFGQHNALLAGIRSAAGQVVVTMDDDLQHRPESVPTLLAALGDEVDLVYGNAEQEEHGFWRNVSSRLLKAALALSLGVSTARVVSAFRVFRTPLRDGFVSAEDPFVSIDVLLSWSTTRVASVSVPMDPRAEGRSNYSFGRLLRVASATATGFSTRPLQFVTALGFGMAIFGVGILTYVLTRLAVDGRSVPGFPFLASIIAIFSGAQLFGLGIIGQYLGRIHFRSMSKPPYLVRTSTDGAAPPGAP